MKSIVILLVIVQLCVNSVFSFAQHSTVFLREIKSSKPGIVEMHFPTGLLPQSVTQFNDTTLGTRIQAAMQALYLKMKPFDQHGIGYSVIVPGLPQYSGGVGTYDDVNPMDTLHVFEMASNTKTFVTALIMRLQDSGKLSIKDSIYKYLPHAYPNVDSAITIKMLLNHSSGIMDYLNDDPQAFFIQDMYEHHPERKWTVEEILMNYVAKTNFAPGTSYKYCNTGFMLLGKIAEIVDGHSLDYQMHHYLFEPLGLTHTYFGGVDSIPSELWAHNFGASDTDFTGYDFSTIDKTAQLSASWGAGNLVTTPGDLARWSHALYLGYVVSRAAVVAMTTTNIWPDKSRYGLGTQYAPYYTHTFYGHTGSLPSFISAQYTNRADSVSVSVFVNWQYNRPDPYMNDYLLAMLDEVYKPASGVKPADVSNNTAVTVWPNPASERVLFNYRVDREGPVNLEVYNLLGLKVATIINEQQSAGYHVGSLNVSGITRGAYVYLLQTADGVERGNFLIE